jgi:DNA-binding transcriptional MocR family regulator
MPSIGSQKKLGLAPIASEPNFTEKAYAALKDVITRMDLYDSRAEIRLDERQLASDLGVSRTPVREALAQLEREGFVRSVPRRGIYVVRKTRSEVIELDHRLRRSKAWPRAHYPERQRPGKSPRRQMFATLAAPSRRSSTSIRKST